MATTWGNKSIVTDNLAFLMDAENYRCYPGSGTAVTDLSTNAGAGVLTGGPVYSSPAFTFDGVNDVLTFGDMTALENDDYTFACWIYRNGTSTEDVIFGYQYQANGADGLCGAYIAFNASNQLEVLTTISDAVEIKNSTSTFTSTTAWYYVEVVKNGTSVKAYVDRVEVIDETVTSGTIDFTTSTNKRTSVGGRWRNATSDYHGDLDADVAFVLLNTSVLTDAQRDINYNATKDKYP